MTEKYPGTDHSAGNLGGDREDELFSVLSHPSRRFTLQYLHNTDRPLTVDELTTELMSWETERPISDRTTTERDTVEVTLLHNHLPKMAEAGLLEYDSVEQTVTSTDRTADVQTHLQTIPTN